MKRLLALLTLLAATSAHAQLQISCGSLPCTNPGVQTNAGDPAYTAFGKDNVNWATLLTEGLFSSQGSSAPGILGLAYGGTGNSAGRAVSINAQAPSATIDTTNASNITSGSLPGAQSGFQTVCNQGTPCNADTLWVNENISCSGSPAVISGMVDNLSLSPYGNGSAQATVTGCGPLSAQNVVQTGITVTAVGSGYAASPAPVAGDYIVVGGGTPVNGSSFTGSIVNATGILTITTMSSGAIVPGQVLTWAGQSATNVTFIRDFISGTGQAGTYQTTYNGGSDLGSTTITGTNRTVIRVLAVSSGQISAAGVVAGGQYSTAPGAPQNQTGTGGATSGAGTSATFTLTYSGLPISGQVASVSSNGFTFVNGVNAVTTVSSTQEQVAIGHPDDAAVAAALAKNPVALIFPTTTQPVWSRIPLGYGFQNQINLPITQRISVLCNGARIIALGPQNAQMAVAYQSNTSLFYKPILDNCDFQGMGVANYNLYESSAQWQIQNSSLENATVENLFIGDSACYDGVGTCDNANDVVVSNIRIHTDTNAVPAWPLYNYELNASADNKVLGSTMDHAIWGGMYVNGADDQIFGTHLFAYGAGPGVDVESSKDAIGVIVDNQAPGQAAYYLNGSLTQVLDGWMDSVASITLLGRYGVYVNAQGRNTIGCGVGQPGSTWSGSEAKLVFFATAQTTDRVAPCTGNGASDPPVFVGNITSSGTAALTNVTISGTCTGCGNPVLIQSSLPFVVTGGCTLSGTGGLSGCGGTATMPNATTHYAYMFFPATQLASAGNGSAAGFYAVQFTSATAGQVCSTAGTPATVVQYTSGYPVEPTACSTFAPNTTGTVTPTTAANLQAANLSLAGNSLGKNGSLEYDWVITSDHTTGTHTSTVKFGSATFAAIAPTTADPAAGRWILRNGGDNQVNTAYAIANTGAASQNIVAASDTHPNQGNAAPQTIEFDLQLSNTSIANEFIILDSYSVKMYASNP